MKYILVLIFILVPIFLAAALGGFYPVALVGNDYILARTWGRAENAARNFSKAQAKSLGNKLPNFETDTEVQQEIKKETLTFLIEDAILRTEGEELIRGFERLSQEKVGEALAQGANLEQAAKLVYGLNLSEFKVLVLLPQARRDMAREVLAERQMGFDPWLADVKKKVKVRLMLVPFTWDGDQVR